MPTSPYVKAADNTRPFGSHRYEVFGPKIGRPVALFGKWALDTWTSIEADPTILSYCERPLVVPQYLPKRIVDFWVQTKQGGQFWILLRPSEMDENLEPALSERFLSWTTKAGNQVRLIRPDNLRNNRLMLENWGWIIRDLSAFGRFVDKQLLEAVKSAISEPVDLGRLQNAFLERDPVLVRVAAFMLLHRGQAQCRSLGSERIAPSTVIQTA